MDPFEVKASKLVQIPAVLRYPTPRAAFGPMGTGNHTLETCAEAPQQLVIHEVDTERLDMHPMHSFWCKDADEAQTIAKVQSFLSHIDWQCHEEATGGITWVELYALYSMHGGSRDFEEQRERNRLHTPLCCKSRLQLSKEPSAKSISTLFQKSRHGTWRHAMLTGTVSPRLLLPTGRRQSEAYRPLMKATLHASCRRYWP